MNACSTRDQVGFVAAAVQRHVVFVTFDNMRILDLTGALDAFSFANDLNASRPPYVLHVVSAAGGMVRSSSGLSVDTMPLAAVDDVEIDTLILAGGSPALRHGSTPAAVDA